MKNKSCANSGTHNKSPRETTIINNGSSVWNKELQVMNLKLNLNKILPGNKRTNLCFLSLI